MWGVYGTEESVHVIPCNDKGKLLFPHTINDFCKCHPEAIAMADS